MNDFFTYNPLWHEQIGRIYALLERVKISEEQTKDIYDYVKIIGFLLLVQQQLLKVIY